MKSTALLDKLNSFATEMLFDSQSGDTIAELLRHFEAGDKLSLQCSVLDDDKNCNNDKKL